MKLYTEEQVRRAMLHSYLSGVERPDDYLPIEESIIKELIPIELPSDEEVEKAGTDLFDKGVDIDYGWIMGAKWMRNKILNK